VPRPPVSAVRQKRFHSLRKREGEKVRDAKLIASRRKEQKHQNLIYSTLIPDSLAEEKGFPPRQLFAGECRPSQRKKKEGKRPDKPPIILPNVSEPKGKREDTEGEDHSPGCDEHGKERLTVTLPLIPNLRA